MSFSDRQLKRLEEHISDCIASGLTTAIPARRTKALLARLDAAERVCDSVTYYYGSGEICPTMGKEYEAWLKSAGKPQGEGGR